MSHPAFVSCSSFLSGSCLTTTTTCTSNNKNSLATKSRKYAARRATVTTSPWRMRLLTTAQKTKKLRQLLEKDQDSVHLMPCCYDGLSAKLIQRNDFQLTFLSGFATAAAHGLPDTGLLSYTDMEHAIAVASSVIDIPLIADGDTGFGNAINVKRTVSKYIQAGASGILIEDQVNPKRCGHTKGKAVVDRDEALTRVKAACDARDEMSEDADSRAVIIARTDAARFDFEEALTRVRLFHDLGADMTFLEAPRSIDEMQRYCRETPGLKLANMLEMGDTPILAPSQLKEIGYCIAAYPLTLVSAAVKAQEEALQLLKKGDPKLVQDKLKTFAELRDVVGFPEYYQLEERYK